MGQYYRAIVTKQNGRSTVYNRYILRDGNAEYMLAKLTEHSWWYNEFVNAVCLSVYNRKDKNRIAWIGDYAETFLDFYGLDTFNNLNQNQISRLTRQCWDCKGKEVFPTDFTLDGLFLINHTKKQFIDCSLYYKNSVMKDKWCIHPLPIITCIGNGLGGGDYSYSTDDSTVDLVGAWAWDEISIENKTNRDYSEIKPIFKEKGWD